MIKKIKSKLKLNITKDTRIILYSFFMSVILASSFLLADTFQGDKIDAVTASLYGSFVGGYVGTILSFLSIVLLYLTFRNQARASEIEKFENKYFEMIRLHRENVQELEVSDIKSRKVFVSMLRELREIASILETLLLESNQRFEKVEFYNIAYLIFYYGVGPNSSRVLKNALLGNEKFNENTELIDRIVSTFEDKTTQTITKYKRGFSYRPFGGHQSRLGHYYRHLFQSVMYVHNRQINIDKYEYIKTIRAQLSNHEQALLFFNSISDLGKNWRSENILVTYGMVKNLPKNFVDSDSEIDIKQVYPDLIFEWEE